MKIFRKGFLFIAFVIGLSLSTINTAVAATEGPNWVTFCLPYQTPTPWGSECGRANTTNGYIYSFSGTPVGNIGAQGEVYFLGWGQQGSINEVGMSISWQIAGFGTSENIYAFVGSTLGERAETTITLVRELMIYGSALHQGQYREEPLRNIAVSLVRNPANMAPLTRFVGSDNRVFHSSMDGRVLFEESANSITVSVYRFGTWKFIGSVYKVVGGAKG